MTLSLKHLFTSGKADGTDVTLVKPSNWNAEHNIQTDSSVPVVLGATGPGPIHDLPISTIMPTGVIVPFAGATAPAGWYLCDGTPKNRISDAVLFAVISTTYGAGDGSTTFNLPDMRGRVPAGVDGGSGRLPGFTTPGVAGGESAHVLSTNEMAYHGHSISNQGSHTHGGAGGGSYVLANAGGSAWLPLTFNDAPTEQTYAYGTTTAATISGGTDAAGANWGHNNIQPTLSMNYIIKT